MSFNAFTILTTLVFASVAGIVALSEEISLKFPKLKFINDIYFKISLVVVVAIGTCLGTIKRQKSAEEEIARDRHNRDSIAEIKRLESNAQLMTSFGEAIGKYELHYDSTTKEVKDIIKRDTSEKIINNIINSSPPSFGLTPAKNNNPFSKVGDTIKCRFYFIAKNTPFNVHVSSFVITDSDKFLHLSKVYPDYVKEKVFTTDGEFVPHAINIDKKSFDSTVMIYLSCSYTNTSAPTNKITMPYLFWIKPYTGEPGGSVGEPYRSSIYEYLKKKRVIK